MDSETEKKLLQKLKENLKIPKEDAFEKGDIVDNLRDEFKQDKNSSQDNNPAAKGKDLNEQDLENETIDNEFKKSEEDKLENEIISSENASLKKEEEKQSSENIIEKKISSTPEKKEEETIKGPAAKPEEPKPLVETKMSIPKKKGSRLGILIFALFLLAAVIAGVLYFMQ